LLAIFLSNPDASFYIRELERKIQEDAKNISRELKNLEDLGLLRSTRQGNQKHFAIVKTYFLFPELKNIIFKTVGVKGILEDAVKKLNGIEKAFIYGSYASGEETESSDIDIMIVGSPDMIELNEVFRSLEDKLDREINYMCFDQKEFNERKETEDPFITEILSKKRIILYHSDE
jgi:predicted nucleotidyltransferase